MAGLDDFLSWLAGGTQMGNFLGIGSPTASTQAPLAVAPGTAPTASGPMLGGQPPPGGGGLLGGLLGGQQPVNPASYFMPRQGLLGDSPLGNMVRGAFSGLSAGAGTGGLTGMGNAFMGGSQAVQDRQKQEMAATLAGQQYKSGQQSLISGALANQSALLHINNIREFNGLPPVTMADITANPDLVSNPTAGQPPAPGSPAATGQSAPATQTMAPAATAQGAPQGTVAGPPPQTAVATQYGNQHGIIVPQPAPPTTAIPSTTNVQPQTSGTTAPPPATAQGGTIPMVGGTTSAPPVTTAAPPTQQGAGDFPQTRAEIEASSLPGWAKQALINAHMAADPYTEVAKVETELGQYFGAPQQAAATKTAEAGASYGTQETINKTAADIRQTLTTDKAYTIYHETKPAADAFRTSLNARGTTDYTGDYDLVLSALKVMNPDAAQPRQGTIISATDLPTMPAKLSKAILALWNNDTALPEDIPGQLANAVQSHMKINQSNYDNLLGNIKVRAKSELPPGYNLRNLDPNTPPPPPPTAVQKDGTVLVLQGGIYDPTKDDGSPGAGWSKGSGKWVPQ